MNNSPPLRIAQVAPLWTPIPPRTYGGIELLLALLTDDLVARGHEVTLFATGDCQTKGRLHPILPVNLSDWFAEGRGWTYETYVNAAMATLMEMEGQFDVIHFHLPPAWVPLAACLKKARALFTMHTCPIPDDEWVFARHPAVEVCGITEAQMRESGARLGRKFPVVYNGADFSSYTPGFEAGRYLAFLGRMSPAKNPAGAIAVARAAGLPIVLAGEPQNPQEREYFAREIQPQIDNERVRWIGPVNHPQKNELLRNASALIFPIAWDEPFGLVMIEAMACGAPVVAVRRGSVGEVVDEGVTGFSAGSVEELAGLVGPALQLDRRAVAAAARARFDFTRMTDGYLDLYRAGR